MAQTIYLGEPIQSVENIILSRYGMVRCEDGYLEYDDDKVIIMTNASSLPIVLDGVETITREMIVNAVDGAIDTITDIRYANCTEEFGISACANCTNLSAVMTCNGTNLMYVGAYAFANCPNLHRFDIWDYNTDVEVDETAFLGSGQIDTIYFQLTHQDNINYMDNELTDEDIAFSDNLRRIMNGVIPLASSSSKSMLLKIKDGNGKHPKNPRKKPQLGPTKASECIGNPKSRGHWGPHQYEDDLLGTPTRNHAAPTDKNPYNRCTDHGEVWGKTCKGCGKAQPGISKKTYWYCPTKGTYSPPKPHRQ